MVQAIRRMLVDGIIEKHTMSFSDSEWKLLQNSYPYGGMSFEKVEEEPEEDTKGREETDDKPNMKDYNVVKDMGMMYFKEEKWEKALYYFEAAYKLKSHAWLSGKINTCKKYAIAEAKVKPKV